MKAKITLLFLILILSFGTYAQTITLRHCATEENINEEYFTVIDNPDLNNNPDLIVRVEKVRIAVGTAIINNPNYISVFYYEPLNKWVIAHEDFDLEIDVGTCYNIMAIDNTVDWATQYKCTSTVEGFPSTCSIDFEPMNDNSQARCLWSRTRDSDNVPMNFPLESYYTWTNPGVWYISTLINEILTQNVVFNIICNPIGLGYFEHFTTASNVFGYTNTIDDYAYWTPLDHEDLNNNPDAMIFIQHRREPATNYVYRSHSVYYDSDEGRWQIHLELPEYVPGIDNFPSGRFYDVYYQDGELSSSENTLAEGFKSFPNPVYETFNIETKKPIEEITLLNMLGQKLNIIQGNGTQNLQIDVSKYSAGYYVAKVNIGNQIETIRFVKH